MPPDRARTSNSQGRQKSCSECAKAKRRCDLSQPHCIRCTRQKLVCTYPPRPHTSAAPTPMASEESPPIVDEMFDDAVLELPFDLDVPSMPAAPHTDVELLDLDFSGPMDSLQEANNSLQNYGGASTIHVPPRTGFSSAKSFSNLVLSELFESRVGYSMEQWKLAPRMMVEKNCTPWSHPNLYEELMPRSMQDAYAACSLYISRTEINSNFVLRHIIERAHELIEQPTPTGSTEILARAHALLLYQVMLISSGDFRYHNQVQTLLPHLTTLSNTLYLTTTEDTTSQSDLPSNPLPLYPSAPSRAAWLTFITRESTRRTLLATCHALSICTLLKGQIVSCNHHLAIGNRVTLSAALWEAKSPLEFAIAWNEKKHFLVRELDFGELLREARASDVDVFGRMLMVGLMGRDDVKGWLHERGGKL